MWSRIVFLSLVISFTISHPTTEENEISRVPRQLDFGDCCPCSHSKSKDSSVRGQDMLADTVGKGARFSDDCSCRLRDADSYGSPSILFPTSMRAERPFVRPADSKEDPKNLLQPEVGLANSVLETIRKATSEEYQEALARDAARSAAKTDHDDYDGTPAESGKNIVTIILTPKETDNFDDVMSEASHIKEARCINPAIGSHRSSNPGKMRIPTSQPTHLMKEIFKFPKPKHAGLVHRNLLDMDSYVSASNVKERVVMDNERLRNNRPMIKQNFYNKNLEINLSDNLSDVSDIDGYRIHSPLIPEKRLGSRNKDLNSNKKKLTSDTQNHKKAPTFRSRPTENNLLQRPPILRNFLKFKDVELIPSKRPDEKFQFKFPKLQLTPFINRKTNPDGRSSKRKSTDLSDLLRNGLKFNFNNRKPINTDNHEDKLNTATSNTNIQIIPRPKDETVDTIPSPSNIDEQFQNNNVFDKDFGNEEIQSTVENNTQMTENNVVKVTQPNFSEDHSFLVRDDKNEKTYETCDSDVILNNNILPSSEEIKPIEPQGHLPEIIQSQGSNEIFSKISSVIQEKETIDEESNEPDINSNECLETLIADQDSISAPNNDVKYNLPDEEKEPGSTTSSLEHVTDFKETCDDDVNKNNVAKTEDQIKPPLLKIKPTPLKETLTTIKESVFKTLDSLKKTTSIMKPELSKDIKTSSLVENNNDETEGHISANNRDIVPDCDSEESEIEKAASTLVSNKPIEDSVEISDTVTTRDLQKLSDSILEASTKKEGTLASKSAEACDSISEEVESTSEAVNEVNQDQDMEPSPTSQIEVSNTDTINKNTESNACVTDKGSLNDIKKEQTSEDSSSIFSNATRTPVEMTAEASSSFLDSVNPDPLGLFKSNNNLGSILLPDIIVQPSSILNNELNIFKQPPVDLGDIFNLKTSIPTLDDIKLQLSSIFNENERDASDDLSYEGSNDKDSTKAEMASAASTSNFQSKLPSLKRLEDVNLDIFQIKPLTKTHSDLIPKIPRLNLNSYRAKLAIPKTMELKPIKVQSALGDKAGLLGATLTIVPDELKLKPLVKLNIDSSDILPDLLGNSMGSIPSLDELHDKMRSSVQSFINTPLEGSNGNVLHNSLQSSLPLDITDSIKAHADNTVKDMQRTMKALKARPPSNLSNFADSIKTPEDLVELASRTREDVSDKLKALHYDLNDRLTSIRESVIDEPKLPLLNAPVFSKNNKITKYNTGSKSNLNMRKKPSTSRNSHRNNLPGRRELQNKIKSQNGKLGESNFKTYKMSSAASVPVPKSVEVPKLKSTPIKSVFPNVRSETNFKPNFKSFEPMQGISNARHPGKSAFDFTKTPLNNPGPFHKETKVTISFSTTPSPTSQGSKNASPEFDLRKGANFPSKINSLGNSVNSLTNNNRNIKGYPSELALSSKSATLDTEDKFSFRPIKQITSKPVFETITKTPLLKYSSKENLPRLLPDSTKLKSPTISDRSISALSRESKGGLEISTWPSVSESTFLSKVREAVKARLANFKPVLSRPDNFEVDMARSPSENVETVLAEPLKENVSYKCRMVCTKE